MSDFDDVLERLLVDPVFQARLAADPDAALAGYRLDPSERQLLNTQLSRADGTDRTVEMRTSKSGIIGMIGPVLSAMGLEAEVGHPPLETMGNAPSHPPLETIGRAPIHGPLESMGSAPSGHVVTSMGQAPQAVESMGRAGGHASMGQAPSIASDYHTHVDADGDGKWDSYVAYNRPDGGVDIEVDMNHDGKADLIGHDYNRDGIIDSADFDNDFDGHFETHMVDTNGDGWMDTAEAIPPYDGPKEAWGGSPSR
jgi:hypothetical protein